MRIDIDGKREILRSFTKILKKIRGSGPRNIYFKHVGKEAHIFFQGVLTPFEKHLIDYFGSEAEEILISFYKRGAKIAEMKEFIEINQKFNLWFYDLECDLIKDEFIFKMKFCD